MRNVLIDSLPADRPQATHDCPICVKRRIRCDRSVPACVKCTSRDLQCPGFKPVYLRWGQGVASRGKLTGKSCPVTTKTIVKRADEAVAKLRKCERQRPALPTSITTLICDHDLIKTYCSTLLFSNLIEHFHARVARRLTWIDLGNNPWRNTLQHIIKHSTSFHLCLAGLAAAHLSVTSISASDESYWFLQAHHWLRDAGLSILTKAIQSARSADCSMPGYETTLSPTAEILASTLALCYCESFVPGSKDWSVHLRACRTVINTLFLRSQEGARIEHPAVAFLVKEVADLETLSNISIFNQETFKTVESQLYPFHNSSIWTFTQLLNDITNTERRRHAALENYQIISEMNMTIWHARADQAYNEILTGPCFDQMDGLQHYFQAVLRTHYYANLIYSYQAFASPEALVTVVESYFDLLIENIQIVVVEATQSFSHDLFFPLFIAGTECCGDQQRQSFVEQLFLDIIFATGVWCNHTALQFLRGFWARSETEVRTTWIQYARANEEESGMFIAF